MVNDVVFGLRMRFVEALLRMEDSDDAELLENRLAKLDFSPTELRSFFDGTSDDVKVSQLRDLADALCLDLSLVVVNRKHPFEHSRHLIPTVARPDGPVHHGPVKARRRIGAMPQGGAFAKPGSLTIDDPAVGSALPSPLAPPALDQPEHLLSVAGQVDSVKRG